MKISEVVFIHFVGIIYIFILNIWKIIVDWHTVAISQTNILYPLFWKRFFKCDCYISITTKITTIIKQIIRYFFSMNPIWTINCYMYYRIIINLYNIWFSKKWFSFSYSIFACYFFFHNFRNKKNHWNRLYAKGTGEISYCIGYVFHSVWNPFISSSANLK